MNKRDHDYEFFERAMQGLAEKPEIIKLAKLGYNAKQTCKKLAISPETFRRWLDSDAEFRTAVYQAITAVYLENPYGNIGK
jgi:protein tyrosine/serine phosphatase